VPPPGGSQEPAAGPPTRRHAIPGRAFTSTRRASARTLHLLTAHPIVTVVVVALLARVVVAVAAVIVTRRYTIPDETLYLELGRNIVNGISPDQWYPGYGQSFYDSVETFSAPLVLLFRIFGAYRVVGGLFSAVVGAATAGLTVAIALRYLRPAFALLAGLVVALLPSQVLFSAVVLREGHIWLMLAVVGFGAVLMMTTDWRRIALGAVLAALGILGLGYLRDQTMLAAAWALGLAVIVTPWRLWPARVAAGVAVAVLIPMVAGSGPGAWNLLRNNAGSLAKTRATLAVDANSAFGGATPPPPTQPSTSTTTTAAKPSAQPPPPGEAPKTPAAAPTQGSVSDTARNAANGEENVRAGLRHLPVGLVDVTLRPFPWSSTVGLSLLMARVETVAWYVLYALGIIGILASLRRREARLALQFPVLLMGMLLGIAALTQGNLGTAFRHREQMVWALALCAAAGLQWLVLDSRFARRRRARHGEPDDGVEAGPREEPASPEPAAGVLTG
jgi:hypothetical protein